MSVEVISGLPELAILPNGMRKLLKEFRILVDGVLIVVPKDFETDLSSYPGITRAIVRFDRVDIAGILHDWLYKTGIKTRAWGDSVWRKIAMVGKHGANKVQGWVSWAGLRAFGWLPYRKYENARPAWRK